MKFSEDVEMEGVRLVGSGHITVPGDGGMALSSENSGGYCSSRILGVLETILTSILKV